MAGRDRATGALNTDGRRSTWTLPAPGRCTALGAGWRRPAARRSTMPRLPAHHAALLELVRSRLPAAPVAAGPARWLRSKRSAARWWASSPTRCSFWTSSAAWCRTAPAHCAAAADAAGAGNRRRRRARAADPGPAGVPDGRGHHLSGRRAAQDLRCQHSGGEPGRRDHAARDGAAAGGHHRGRAHRLGLHGRDRHHAHHRGTRRAAQHRHHADGNAGAAQGAGAGDRACRC